MNYTYNLPLSHRNRTAQERRRFQAMKLFAKGHTQAEVARRLKVSREAVRKWHDRWQQKGINGLKSLGKPGPKPRLAPDKLKDIERALLKGPNAYGFTTQIWTLNRIAAVIKRVAHISYGTTRVWQILLSLDWSCQKPETRAAERDEAAIQRWVKVSWPQIKKKRTELAQS